MQIARLALMLSETYERAPIGDKSISVCLFGIRHADDIGSSTSAVIDAAGIGKYGPELRKGIKLSQYVRLK